MVDHSVIFSWKVDLRVMADCVTIGNPESFQMGNAHLLEGSGKTLRVMRISSVSPGRRRPMQGFRMQKSFPKLILILNNTFSFELLPTVMAVKTMMGSVAPSSNLGARTANSLPVGPAGEMVKWEYGGGPPMIGSLITVDTLLGLGIVDGTDPDPDSAFI